MNTGKFNIQKTFAPRLLRCCIAVCVCMLFMHTELKAQTLTIICNKKGAPDVLKLDELKSVMKGERQRWSNGTKVSVAIMKTNTNAGRSTARIFYNMTGDALLKYRMALAYQGNTNAPKLFSTAEEIQAYVAETPGAVGIIDQPFNSSDTKILTVDGKNQFSL